MALYKFRINIIIIIIIIKWRLEKLGCRWLKNGAFFRNYI